MRIGGCRPIFDLSLYFFMEIWKDITGYEGLYQVSNLGNVRNTNGKILKDRFRKEYKSVVLYKNKIGKPYSNHRLVAYEFILNVNNKPCVNHINGNKIDNVVSNLEWVNSRENSSHRYINKTLPTGVSKVKKCQKYTAQIIVNKKKIYLGNFDLPSEASKAYNNAIIFYNLENKYS